jgi:hypothetical protein
MKKRNLFLPFLVIIFIFSSCRKNDENENLSETPIYHFYEGFFEGAGYSSIFTGDNGILICGRSSSKQSLVIKVNKFGEEVWRKEFVMGPINYLTALIESNTGEFYGCGGIYKVDSDIVDLFIIKMNNSGDSIWSKRLGDMENEVGGYFIKTMDGNLLVVGSRFNNNSLSHKFLLKINENGDSLWVKNLIDPTLGNISTLVEDEFGNFLIMSSVTEYNINSRIYLKLNSLGEQIWNKSYSDSVDRVIYPTIELPSGELVSTGSLKYNIYEDRQVLLLKTDNIGNLIWEKSFGEAEYNEFGSTIIQDLDGNFVITGRSDNLVPKSDIILLKVDSEGNLKWYKRFGSDNADISRNSLVDDSGDIFTMGDYNLNQSSNYNGTIFLTITDKNGKFK